MSHEIYYTSAPEGLKRGTSGFSTVNATEGIPRALWDRLEALSAYRHHVSSASEAGKSSGNHNPASYAHWLLNVAGATYHVLSHVCDSGVDHTQRTNAFAHHLVVEPSEMAPAGPAWMLQQPGVMQDSWNGTVGTLPGPRALPRGDDSPAVCHAWASLTGDAGWAGALAESAMRTPAKPVCILFSEDQDPLPLIAEALRLLPATKRWDVTFNTYFTSMPTSATCLWRCCLKGTPAADVGLRYAANGLILDLTDPSSLGTPPDSDYVTLARTGVLSATMKLRNQSPAIRNAPRPSFTAPAGAPAPREAPGSSHLLTEVEETPPSPETKIPPIAPPVAPPTGPAVAPNPTMPWGASRLTDVMHTAEDDLAATQTAAANAAKKRRTQILMLYIGAVAAIGLGSYLVYVAYKNSAPPEVIETLEPPKPQPHQTVDVTPPPQPDVKLPDITVKPPDTNPDVPTVKIDEPPVPPVNNNNLTRPPEIKPPKVIELKTALDRVTAGSGLADKSQSIRIGAAEFADLKAITALTLHFPGQRKDYPYKHENLNGTLIAETTNRNGNLGTTLRWKDAGDLTTSDVVVVELHRQRASLELTWKTGLAVKRPELMTLAYWVLQNSALSADMPPASGGPQRIEFKPVETRKLNLKDAASTYSFPAEIPRETAVVPGVLPPGWSATWYTDWEVKDTALRTPENASQVLKFRKPTTSAAVDSMFLLSFRPGFKTVESDYAKRLAAAERDLANFESDLRAINSEIQKIKRDFNRSDPTLENKKLEAEALVTNYKAAVAGYKEIESLEISLNLPDGLKIGALNFTRDGK